MELTINLLRPVTARRIVATGKVVKAGKTLVVTEAKVADAATGKALAKMLATMIPSPVQEE